MIAGLIGSGLALEFRSWCSMNSDLPDIEGIFDGTEFSVPKTSDAMYAVITSMSEYAKDHKYELDRIGHSLNYASKFPADYVAILLKEYEAIDEDYKDVLVDIPEYTHLISKRGALRNGRV